ncbi:lysyl oxidase homolog 4-like [Paramacrobiotus metropolitanus]|uniref:lysyl oxidase homolog 4-like n=1 Tax=Paramacrobiotus metropolitanus TaxID=2943436 RepID=UPI0024459343|nr:lysyl oxidase homolog 4-like [Paramacrobiotus metropolitanus]
MSRVCLIKFLEGAIYLQLLLVTLVSCQPEDGEVRLVGGTTEFEGNVQVYHDRRWGYVCDDGWDLRDATVLCRQLGFPRSDFATTASRFGLTHGHIWLSNVQCWGYERNLTSCRSDGWGSGEECDTSEAAGVICKARLISNGTQPRARPNRAYITHSAPRRSPPRTGGHTTTTAIETTTRTTPRPPTTKTTVRPTPMLIADENPIPLANDIFLLSDRRRFQLRLAGGRNNREGRVEVRWDGAGEWGVICGNGWSLKETDVVCRQLGLGVGSRAIQNVLFTGPQRAVVLSGVACNGHEKNLVECLHKDPQAGQAECRGRESIAGVMCSTELPDLVPDMDFLMSSVYLQDQPMFYLTCAMEENCLSSSAYQLDQKARNFPWITRRLLRFTLATKNVGKADFVSFIPKHLWQWHACHKHYHSMEVFAHFDILDEQGRRVAEGHKASFCLEDNACDQAWQKKYNCANFGDQGISVGCFDIYKHDVDCQWIDLTDVKAGVYTFKASVNPDTKVAEMSYDNNVVLCRLYYYDTTAYFDDCRLAGHSNSVVGIG